MRFARPIIVTLAILSLAGCREKEEELPFRSSVSRPGQQSPPPRGQETPAIPPSVEVAEWPELLEIQEKIATRFADTEGSQIGRIRGIANETSIEVVMFLTEKVPPVRDLPAVQEAKAELDDISKQLMRAAQMEEEAIRAEFARLEANLEKIRIAAGVPKPEKTGEETQ